MAPSPGSNSRLSIFVLSLAIISGGLSGWAPPLWRSWAIATYNQILAWAGPQTPPSGLFLIAIDDASLQQGQWFAQQRNAPNWSKGLGQLPWPRASYATLVEKLRAAGADAVALNVLFEGPSSRSSEDDNQLAATLARHKGHVVLAAEMLEPNDSQGAGGLSLAPPFLALQQAAGGTNALGLTNMLKGEDNAVGPHPEAYISQILKPHGFALQRSLPLALMDAGAKKSRQPDALRALRPYGPEGHLPRLSAWEVLDPHRWQQQPLRKKLKGALVLVGPTLNQGENGHNSAFGVLSGLELLGTASANSIDGTGIAPWPATALARALVASLPLLLLGLIGLQRSNLSWRLGCCFLGFILLLLVSSSGLLRWHRALPLLAPAAALILLASGFGFDGYWREERERRRLRRTFERYVAPSVVAEILQNREAAEGILLGKNLPVTVLFSDLKGFTALTQRLSKEGRSTELVQQLNTYLGAMVAVITAHGGTVDKFIGDAVMAVFGSPRSRGIALEAAQAVRCAIAMGERLEQLNQQWQIDNIAPLASGIGIASGDAVVGQIGSPERMDFTVIGNTVNLASRLESLTRLLNTPIIIDERTAELMEPQIKVINLGEHIIKGIGEVPVYKPES
ncbi:adenylate/guanylate cyclase domain-containing protein [Synechococcus sp. UW140]|uniref:adenylate/guanylate cyclase domain-containing protein n=1 Tax=Synechococcus sp. UW140 TaxID=368503 RepID=UPI0025ED542E|nr:adenylate/guanylate cyclase domain-containing protein [Synechococcus sp. UW140]